MPQALLNNAGRPYISHLELENFMCHEKFVIDFNSDLNLVIGRNGSGKSTILTALMIVLGSQSSATSRASKLQELIKWGTQVAYITLVVSLPADARSAYYLKYGPQVTIIKRISKSGSSVTFKNSDMKAVTVKSGLVEAKALASYCGFYPANPLAVLTQENAKEFLVSATAKKKYDRLREALHADRARVNILDSESRMQNYASLLEDSVAEIDTLVEEVESGETFFRQVGTIDERMSALKRTIAWINVAEQEEMVVASTEQVSQAQAKMSENSALMGEDSTILSDRISRQIREVQDKQEERRASCELLNVSIRTQEDKVSDLQHSHGSLAMQINRARQQLTESEQAVADLEAQFKHQIDPEKSRERILESIATLESEANKINEVEIFQLNVQTTKAREEIAELGYTESEQQLADIDAELRKLESDLAKSRSGEKSSGSYGPNLQSVLLDIENERRWRFKPVGPLGQKVRITDAKWARLLEKMFFRTNTSFWVQTPEDKALLRRILLNHKMNVPIIERRAEIFDFSQGSIGKNSRYSRVIDVLNFDTDYIRSLYVDCESIERIALCNSLSQAQIVADASSREAKLSLVYALDASSGEQQGFRLSCKVSGVEETEPVALWNGAGRMRIGKEAQIRQLQEDISVLHRQRLSAMDSVKNARLNREAHLRHLAELQKQVKSREARVLEIQAEINLLRTEFDNLTATNEEDGGALLQQAIDRKNKNEKMVDAGNQRLQAAVTNLNLAKDELGVLKAQRSKDKASIEASVRRIGDLNHQLDTYIRKRTMLERELLRAKVRLEHASEEAEATRTRLDELVHIAEKFGPRAADGRDTQHGPVSELKEKLRELEAHKATFAGIEEQLEQRSRRLDTSKARLDAIRAAHEQSRRTYLDENLAVQRRAENFELAWNHWKQRITGTFETLLSQRLGFSSKLYIDDSRRTLDAQVQTKETEVRRLGTLSGGEKSFAQLALLISVWKCMSVNLVAMDEYDVYMDKVNRQRALRLLLDTILEKGQQCILITPQDADAETLQSFGSGIHIHRIPSPR